MRKPSEKYAIGWGMLTAYITRKKKKEALALFKLLARHIDNASFVKKIEGDIYFFHGDYAQASACYQQAGKECGNVKECMIYKQAISFCVNKEEGM